MVARFVKKRRKTGEREMRLGLRRALTLQYSTAMRPLSTFVSLAFCADFSFNVTAAQFKIGAHNFTLPDGFEIELVAGTNLVPRPIEADFDEFGRLYVTDSSGSNDKVEKQLAEKPHRVVRLEDADGDGRFDKSITFADKMMLPQGCLWFDGSLYVAAPPSIWKLTDTNSDGVADVRVEWFQGKTLTGCANDLHGPYAGPDGWIYWCKGAFAKQTYTLPNGKEFTTRASHIFRARPDGTGVEPVMTGGMDNPVGLAFTAEGERILSGTFFQNPEGGKRDGLIHALYGGVYGKPNDALEGHPRTGDLLPIMTHLGAAAPAGLMRYESDVFGKDFQNNLFVACFNMHKIVRCVMQPDGATYKTTDSDFLVSDNPDFHPTDVLEDADGSLIVVDTGGWYKLCCPTSQLHKPDVLGGIYRVSRKSATKINDPRGGEIKWSALNLSEQMALLSDSRPSVAAKAVALLAKQGNAAAQAIGTNRFPSKTGAQNALWALARNDSAAATEMLIKSGRALEHSSLRRIVAHALGQKRDAAGLPLLADWLNGDAPACRAAAEALGRLGDESFIPGLLNHAARVLSRPEGAEHETSPAGNDRALEHALTYALIELNRPNVTTNGLHHWNPFAKRVVLIALDQMPGSNLQVQQVVPLLGSTNQLLRGTALWIIARHPEWSAVTARWLSAWLNSGGYLPVQDDFATVLARGTRQPDVQQLLADMAGEPGSYETALTAMTRSRLDEIPAAWGAVISKALKSNFEGAQKLAIAAATAFASAKNQTNLTEPLQAFARDPTHSKQSRLDALAALPSNVAARDTDTFEFLRAGLSSANSVAERSVAAGVLARAKLNESQLLALAESAKEVGPIELPKLLGAFARATNENVGLTLVASLQKSKSLASLRAETVNPQLTNFPASVRQKADALLASLNTDAAQQKKHIDTLLASVKGGDIRRGQALFNSAKAACSACHAIGYLGGKVGPDLTRIGQIRNERDLLEAIVYPSASFVRSYEPMLVATKSGEEFSGVLRKDAAEEVVLATGPNTEQRLARAEIQDMRPGSVSTMPAGLAEQLTKEELADLLAFLRATRW
jgi:putative membrane-bound dehydrogenase-like protein